MNNSFPEGEFIAISLSLEKKNQDIYDETRRLAQTHKWEEHINLAMPMIPILHYLGYKDWISRMFGRIAWSYIRLRDFSKSDSMLKWAEEYDVWQAAANYYWASEYSHRGREDIYAVKCINEFKRIVKMLEIDGKTDLELAVNFYDKLQEKEKRASFYNENNMSDRGRYLELKARLNQDSFSFLKAAELYHNAMLEPYAACCRAFSHMIKAQLVSQFNKKREEFDLAYKELDDTCVFEDEYIKKLLMGFIGVRKILCDILLIFNSNSKERILVIEEKCKEIYDCFFNTNLGLPLSSLALNIEVFSSTAEWENIEKYVQSFKDTFCYDDIKYYQKLDNLFDLAQKKLPSFSFLTI